MKAQLLAPLLALATLACTISTQAEPIARENKTPFTGTAEVRGIISQTEDEVVADLSQGGILRVSRVKLSDGIFRYFTEVETMYHAGSEYSTLANNNRILREIQFATYSCAVNLRVTEARVTDIHHVCEPQQELRAYQAQDHTQESRYLNSVASQRKMLNSASCIQKVQQTLVDKLKISRTAKNLMKSAKFGQMTMRGDYGLVGDTNLPYTVGKTKGVLAFWLNDFCDLGREVEFVDSIIPYSPH